MPGRRPVKMLPWQVWLPLLVLVSGALVAGLATGWLPSLLVPRKITVRGCSLTNPRDVLLALHATGRETYPQLYLSARRLNPESLRWVSAVSLRLAWEQSALLDVAERQPLLQATAGGGRFWLCSDGSLVACDPTLDRKGVFDRIRQLPLVEDHLGLVDGRLVQAQTALEAAACCESALPGAIARIVLAGDGTVSLFDRGGFEIRLGQPEKLEQKIGALPKALRVCAQDKQRMQCLDASNPRIFYQRWKEAVNTASAE